ncbi:MAG: capsular polysaccharide biosynthesis protein [Eubacterium sp.]|nr:capsular polysaccharide biosynthesis protein [Candidatus Colimonas fimequi]
MMEIIDFHSHVLPGIDDGSRNIETSMNMLAEEKRQGIDVVVATPHFYAWRNRIERFLDARRETAVALREALASEGKEGRYPDFVVGAEVAYFRGIGMADILKYLTIEGTKTLLIEMPMEEWSESYVEDLRLMKRSGYRVVLAHVERYMGEKRNVKYIERLIDEGFIMQINAATLMKWPGNGKYLKMFKKGDAHLLGSDAHGMNHRPANIGEGREMIEKKCGAGVLREIDALGSSLINR